MAEQEEGYVEARARHLRKSQNLARYIAGRNEVRRETEVRERSRAMFKCIVGSALPN